MEGLGHMLRRRAPGSDRATAPVGHGWSLRSLDLSVDLQHVAIGVSKEQGAVAEGMIGWPRDDVHSPLCEDGGTTCNLTWGHAERKLQRKCPDRKGRIVEPSTVFS